jgi:hypothetical protein
MNSYNNNSFNYSRSYRNLKKINSNKNRNYITKKDEIKYSSSGSSSSKLTLEELFNKPKNKNRLEDK